MNSFSPVAPRCDRERGRKTIDSGFAPAVRCSAPDSFFVLAKRCRARLARSLFMGVGRGVPSAS